MSIIEGMSVLPFLAETSPLFSFGIGWHVFVFGFRFGFQFGLRSQKNLIPDLVGRWLPKMYSGRTDKGVKIGWPIGYHRVILWYLLIVKLLELRWRWKSRGIMLWLVNRLIDNKNILNQRCWTTCTHTTCFRRGSWGYY